MAADSRAGTGNRTVLCAQQCRWRATVPVHIVDRAGELNERPVGLAVFHPLYGGQSIARLDEDIDAVGTLRKPAISVGCIGGATPEGLVEDVLGAPGFLDSGRARSGLRRDTWCGLSTLRVDDGERWKTVIKRWVAGSFDTLVGFPKEANSIRA
jgi:hypothetical protein